MTAQGGPVTAVPGTISRAPVLQPGAVYAELRAQAVALMQLMAGDVWTDYNFSDPGVTVLEQLCYALTELPYRAALPVAELLAPPEGGRLPLRRHGLFPVWAILPCDPVTADDLRRVALDRVPGAANVWFTPKPAHAAPAGVVGLYDVDILALPEHTAENGGHERLVQRLERCYAGCRALCEGLHRVRVLAPVRAYARATLTLADGADPSDTLAQALFALGLCLAPEPKRQSLDERLADGEHSTTDVFFGPLMLRGFIADDQLTPLPARLEVNALVQALAQVPGVLAVDRFALDVAGHPAPYRHGDTIAVPEHCVLQLQTTTEDGHATVHLVRNHMRCEPDMPRTRRQLALLWQQQRQTFRLRPEYARRYAPPAAVYRDLALYSSVQNQFPQIYGIGPNGLPTGASPARQAQAKQLQGYLMPFDQLLADSFSQLAFVRKLFSVQAGGHTTYANQSLRRIAPGAAFLLKRGYEAGLDALTAEADPVNLRRNAVLDLLLGFYALQLAAPAGSNAAGAGTRTDGLHRRAKQALLRRAAAITRGRGQGLDTRRPDSRRGMTGVERSSRIALGLLDDEPAEDTQHGRVGDARHGAAAVVHDPAEATFGRLQRPDLWPALADASGSIEGHPGLLFDDDEAGPAKHSPLAGHRVAARLLHALGDPGRYRVHATGDSQTVFLACSDAFGGWWIIGRYSTEAPAIALVRELLRAMGWRAHRQPRRALYVVEWLLLRPIEPAAGGHRYSLRITAVLSDHEDERNQQGWRQHTQAIVRENTPAHIALDCVFLSPREMRHFEPLYALWTRSLREGPPALRAEANEHMARFLERHAAPPPQAPAPAVRTAPQARSQGLPADLAGLEDLADGELLQALLSRLAVRGDSQHQPEPGRKPEHGRGRAQPREQSPDPAPAPDASAPVAPTIDPAPALPQAGRTSRSSSVLGTLLGAIGSWLQSAWQNLLGRRSPAGPPAPAAPPPTSATPSVQPAQPGAMGFDTDTPLTPDTAKAFAAAGFHFAVRYLSRGTSQGEGDLTAQETQTLLSAGLSVMAVQHVAPPGWAPSADLGTQYGQAAAGNAVEAGLPAGVTLWLDLEGVAGGTDPNQVVAYCNAWFAEVIGAGYTTGVYVGADCGLSAEQLSEELQCARFWKSSSQVPSIVFCMVQTSSRMDALKGVAFDRDTVVPEGSRHPPMWLAPA